jgi:hypothetical protein
MAEDRDHIKRIYSAIASNNDPTLPPFFIAARCGREDDGACIHR